MKRIACLIILLSLSACIQTFTLQDTAERMMFDRYTVASSEETNQLITDDAILWTQNGPILEVIEFWKPVADGEKLPLSFGKNKDKAGKFNKNMAPEEILELVQESMTLTPLVPISIGNLQPAKFGDNNGYIIDLLLSSNEGNDFKGNLLFATVNDELLIIYLNARETHYYEARKPVFDRVVASIKM